MRVELKNIEIGSCCSASSEASTRAELGSGTCARPPLLATRWADHLGHKEARFQGVNPRLFVEKHPRNSRQSKKPVLDGLDKMMPLEIRK